MIGSGNENCETSETRETLFANSFALSILARVISVSENQESQKCGLWLHGLETVPRLLPRVAYGLLLSALCLLPSAARTLTPASSSRKVITAA